MATDANAIACALIEQLEQLRLAAYPDPVSRGKPYTIGFGNTCLANGATVTLGCRLADRAAAVALFSATLDKLQPKLAAMLTVTLEPCQIAALLSLQYNVGSTALRTSTLLRLLNAGNRIGAADQFLAWDKGEVDHRLVTIHGLETRRQLERAVFLGLVDITSSAPAAARPTPAAAAAPSHHVVTATRPAPAPAAIADQSTADLNDAELARVQSAGTPDGGATP